MELLLFCFTYSKRTSLVFTTHNAFSSAFLFIACRLLAERKRKKKKKKSEHADKISDFVEGNYFNFSTDKCKEKAFIWCDYNKNNVRSAQY